MIFLLVRYTAAKVAARQPGTAQPLQQSPPWPSGRSAIPCTALRPAPVSGNIDKNKIFST